MLQLGIINSFNIHVNKVYILCQKLSFLLKCSNENKTEQT